MRNPIVVAILLSLAACSDVPDAALGTLERERITLPAPASEPILEISVREGDRVHAGDVVVVLDAARSAARVAAARADLERQQHVLAEARSGPRSERIDEVRQRVVRARSVAGNARRERDRIEAVVARGLLPVAERDRARAASDAADADVRAAQAALAELEHGSRPEVVAQAEAGVAAAQAQLDALAVDLRRIQVVAPRDGIVDSLPFEVGDQVPAGAPLATLLVGERVHVRVHVPQPLRLGLEIGSAAQVFVHGDPQPHAGRVRTIRHEASFTPYYALHGEDAAQLSYLAEVELGADADALPLGLPVRVEFVPAPAAAR